MANYLLAYTGGTEPQSEEEGKAVMDAWVAWFTSLGAAVVDPGNPTGPAATVASDGSGILQCSIPEEAIVAGVMLVVTPVINITP